MSMLADITMWDKTLTEEEITKLFKDSIADTNNGVITGGVTLPSTPTITDAVYTPNMNAEWMTDRQHTVHIPEGSSVRIGSDFTMSAKEFEICMKMLLKQAMVECPEEFI